MVRTKATESRTPSYPPRDAYGRIATWTDMLGGVAFSMILGVILLFVIDGLFSVIGGSGLGGTGFGSFSGWVAGVLAVWMFVEDFRAWKGVRARAGILLIAAALAFLAGGALNVAIDSLPRVYSGAISVTLAAAVYAVVWYFGIRALAGRVGER